MQITTVGLDLAKPIFFVHAVDAGRRVVVARSLRRRELLSFFAALPACRAGMEAWRKVYLVNWHRNSIADEVDGSRSRHLGAKVWRLSKHPRAKGATHHGD